MRTFEVVDLRCAVVACCLHTHDAVAVGSVSNSCSAGLDAAALLLPSWLCTAACRRLNAIALDRGGSRALTAGEDRAARLWSLPAAAPGASQSGAAGPGGQDAGGLGIVGSVALELELTGHGLSSLGTGGPELCAEAAVLQQCAWSSDCSPCPIRRPGRTTWEPHTLGLNLHPRTLGLTLPLPCAPLS